MMAMLFFILISIPALKWFQIHYDMPFEDKVKAEGNGENSAESYWKRKSISLKDIAVNMGAAFALVAVSVKIAGFFKSVFSHPLLTGTFGDQYLVLTTLTVLVIFLFPRFFEKLNGSQELGTYFIYLFFCGDRYSCRPPFNCDQCAAYSIICVPHCDQQFNRFSPCRKTVPRPA